MKVIHKTILILSITMLTQTSVAVDSYHSSEARLDCEFYEVTDTSRKNQLIRVDSFYLDILPPSAGVQFYKDGIMFLSSTKNTSRMVAGHISFGTNEMYVAIPGDSALGTKYRFSPASSFSYPSDALTFNRDYKIMYFTNRSKTSFKEQIYQADFSSVSNSQPDWHEETEPLAFCNDSANYSHPALSGNGELMIFASDGKGSAGGMDLFISKKEGDSWSSPVSMGNEINTKGNELFPFLDMNNNLFFSSDGLPGLGGYDIFTCKFNGLSWENPINLTQLINKEGDDVAFTMNRKDGVYGFYTSWQKSGKRIKQLFRVSLNRDYNIDSLKSLSDIFYRDVLPRSDLTAIKTDDSTVFIKAITSEEKKEAKPVEISAKADTLPAIIVAPPQTKVTIVAEIPPKKEENVQAVIYRIQFETNIKSKGSYKISINNENYNTFEYFYKGSYRSTVGEFKNLSEAIAFQNTCRRSGYPSSFVAAFVNNVRSLDPGLFKK
jgi:hypothetical protein